MIEPQLCERIIPTEIDKYLDNPDYIYEEKYDGTRCLAIVRHNAGLESDGITLQNRKGEDITERFPEIVEELAKLKTDIILDGEIVILNGNGVPNFNLLQQRTHLKDTFRVKLLAKKEPATFIAFDILELNGKNLRHEILTKRKESLLDIHGLLTVNNISRVQVATWYEKGYVDIPEKFAEIVTAGGEGMVAKRKDSTYIDGSRSPDWIKLKKYLETDCVILGYTKGEGRRDGVLGALVLGQYDKAGELNYVGKVGTGFDDEMLARISFLLENESNALNELPEPHPAHHVVEKLPGFAELKCVPLKYIAEVRFMERTKDGILRHPVFCSLRFDKPIQDCVIE